MGNNIRQLMAGAALAAIVAVGVMMAPEPARAQAVACTQSCQAAYAQCYRDSGSNRRACEARLQQCLAGCINKR